MHGYVEQQRQFVPVTSSSGLSRVLSCMCMMNRLSMAVIWSFSFSSTLAIIDQYYYICSIMKGQISMLHHRLVIVFLREQILISSNKQTEYLNRQTRSFLLFMIISITSLRYIYIYVCSFYVIDLELFILNEHIYIDSRKRRYVCDRW